MFETLNQVKTKPVKRIRTRMDGIDWLYGFTRKSGYDKCDSDNTVWGLPISAISLWSGRSGLGKSRLAVELARKLARLNFRVLYFQNEMPKETFVSKVKSDQLGIPTNFYVSESNTLADQLADIRKSKAQIVFVDSINMLEEFGAGADSSIKRIIQGDEEYEGYREVCTETGCHVIFLSQLTKDGSARGSSTLPHLVDIVFEIGTGNYTGGGSEFYLKVDGKHRFGKTGGYIVFEHDDVGVNWISIRSDEVMREDHDWSDTFPDTYPYEDLPMRFARYETEDDIDNPVQTRTDLVRYQKNYTRNVRHAMLGQLSINVGNLLKVVLTQVVLIFGACAIFGSRSKKI